MKAAVEHRRAFRAWLRSLPLALGFPGILWVVSGIFSLALEPMMILVVLISTTVHLFAYLVTGLPIFLVFFRNPGSPVWMPWFGIPMGVVLGATVLVLLLYRGAAYGEATIYYLGGGYGAITAIAALRQRPTLG